MMKQIYLAGGFYGEYKQVITVLLGQKFRFYDPEYFPSLPGYFVGEDLNAINKSDLVIAHQDNYPYVYGMAAEIGYAAAIGRPVIYICTGRRVDVFLAGLSKAVFTEIDAACEFVLERYAET